MPLVTEYVIAKKEYDVSVTAAERAQLRLDRVKRRSRRAGEKLAKRLRDLKAAEAPR
jgi:hypothetical protein